MKSLDKGKTLLCIEKENCFVEAEEKLSAMHTTHVRTTNIRPRVL